MREAGSVDNEMDANLFRDFLYNRGIECDIEPGSSGKWTIWIHDENRIAEAEELLQQFSINPTDARYVSEAAGAEDKRAKQESQEREFAKKLKSRDDIFTTYGFSGIGLVTLTLIVISVVITLLCKFGQNLAMVQWFSIAEIFPSEGRGILYFKHLQEVRQGQVWRLITPIFLHLGFMHILFNMMWLRDLGSMMENIRGRGFIIVFVLLTGAASNVAQFYVSGPSFGGMSGVVYALLGYVWMQSRFNPWSGFVMHSTTVQMMLIWFVLCLSRLIGNVANTVHAVGLVSGVAWGYLDARRSMNHG